MLYGFIGRVSNAPQLRDALSASNQRIAGISQRVSAASMNQQSGFAIPGGTGAPASAVDVEAEMTSLADEALRKEAIIKLLDGAYEKLRMTIRDR